MGIVDKNPLRCVSLIKETHETNKQSNRSRDWQTSL